MVGGPLQLATKLIKQEQLSVVAWGLWQCWKWEVPTVGARLTSLCVGCTKEEAVFRYYRLSMKDYQEHVRTEQEKLEHRLKHH